MKKITSLALVLGSFILAGAENASAAPIQAYTKPAAQSVAAQTGEITRVPAVRMFIPQAVVPQTAGVEARRSTRSYSYVPGSAPVVRSARPARPARVPSYMLPKSDPRKYNGF
jgi:hypothetical protein